MNRLKYIVKRVLMSVPVLWLGTSMTWFIIYQGPVDPAANLLSGNERLTEAKYEAARTELGLDQPPLQHYVDWMWSLFTLDLGQTWLVYTGSNVGALVLDFLPRTVWLGFWSVLIAICIGVPLGFYAGIRSNSVADYVASVSGIVWRAMPNFWLAVILLALLVGSESLFGFDWDTFLITLPSGVTGNPGLSYMAGDPLALFTQPRETLAAIKKILPAALVLGSASMGNEMRIGRTAVLETKNEQYVDFARARGVPGRAIVWKHVFRNALVPLVPVITTEAFLLIGGSVLVESVFGINGMGKLFFDAAIQGDLPLVGSLMFVFIVLMLTINIAQDILYTLIDPRVGYDGT
ncbi:ABC transporter permease subunit [Halobaculum sp. WSA2]|uniref:ABC transporter permease subunit n=1 Tax=Halobaculum saliterrae TaxID=2073113 RepID=A0A6B0SWB9_9EURY|nr:ABC transporter permease [Halobaculum saliterrae]MXR40923.1 ABC transporter permease subunit [Halobaculum saliterrae]